jgi:apolipoprotein D and lipocalin family protein
MKYLFLGLALIMISCTHKLPKTVDFLDKDRFMGIWYVQAGRFTMLEKDVHNGIETYKWNQKENRIDIDFTFNQGSLTGKIKSLPQRGWIHNHKTNAHWKVSPLWPLKFDYLVIGLGKNYDWTVIGVPNQNYLWIMTRERNISRDKVDKLINEIKMSGYRTDDITYVPHSLIRP